MTNVSRETLVGLESLVAMLRDWNARHNLVSERSLADVWRRHVLDSAQLSDFIPEGAGSLADLGSGAGFPGMVLAMLLRRRAGFRTVLFEATRKKCAFLAAAAEHLGLCVDIRNQRIEEADPEPFDVVTARACAPLARLLPYASRFQSDLTVNLFLKGQNIVDELTVARKYWSMKVATKSSSSDPSGVILVIQGLRHA